MMLGVNTEKKIKWWMMNEQYGVELRKEIGQSDDDSRQEFS